MIVELFRCVILAFSSFGFYSAMILIEKNYGKKTALIVSLILGALTIIGLILRPMLKV